jgi:cytochrome P450
MNGSVFATGPNDLHRVRRTAVDPFFSTQNVRKLQPVIQELADKVVSRLRRFRDTGEVIHAGAMFAAYSNGKFLSLTNPSLQSK